MAASTISFVFLLCFNLLSIHALSLPIPRHFAGDDKRNLEGLRKWADENGIEFAKHVGFETSNEAGWDENNEDWAISLLDAGDDGDSGSLVRGSVLLSVPKTLVLSSSNILVELGGDSALLDAFDVLHGEDFGNFKGEFLLVLKVLKEVDQGESSQWAGWIRNLPKRFSTGVCLDEVEMECLPAFSRALADYEVLKLQAFGLAAGKVAQDWIPDLSTEEGATLLKWAFNVVYTRCWKFADNLENSGVSDSDIVPIGDLFNHKDPANVAVENSPESETVDFVLQCKARSCNTDFSLSYGTTNPHRFLVIFGFVDESMPEIFSQVTFPNPSADHITLGCDDQSKMVYRTNDGAISEAIWDSVLYALLQAHPQKQKTLVDAHRHNEQSTKKELHAKYALETALTLRNHVSATLRELEMLAGCIEEARHDHHSGLRENIALIEKHNKFLCNVFGKVNERLISSVEEETLRRRAALSNT